MLGLPFGLLPISNIIGGFQMDFAGAPLARLEVRPAYGGSLISRHTNPFLMDFAGASR